MFMVLSLWLEFLEEFTQLTQWIQNSARRLLSFEPSWVHPPLPFMLWNDEYQLFVDVNGILLYCWQIVVCQNNSQLRPLCCNVLAHEMIHMFDFCRADVDFKHLEHLACTEVCFVKHFSLSQFLSQFLAQVSSSICWTCEAIWLNLHQQYEAPGVHRDSSSTGIRWRYVTLSVHCHTHRLDRLVCPSHTE